MSVAQFHVGKQQVKRRELAPSATGTLMLQLGKAGDPAVFLVLEGTVAKDIATGTIAGDMGGGTFTLTKKAAVK